jgi:Domain of unknown function (DUF4166)
MPTGAHASVMMTNADDWLHRFHTGTVSATAAGLLDVDPGKSGPIRVLGRLLRLPPPATGQTTRLRIVRQVEGASIHERWIRTFGSASLATRQLRTGEQISERAGPVECRMRCRATASDIWYIPAGAAVILGRLSVRLPGLIAPQACAHAWSSGDSAFGVEVSVRVPLIGVLMSYRGHFTEVDE